MEDLNSRSIIFGNEIGFSAVTFYSEFKGESVFIAENEGEISCTGYPVLIIANYEGVRLANSDETLAIMGITPLSNVDGERLINL